MKKIVTAGFALCFFVCMGRSASSGSESVTSSEPQLTQGDPYKVMAKELYESAELPDGSKIAIMPFSYGKEKKSDVGLMVSERLTTRIVKLHKFKVIERQMLENVMQELHLEGTGAVDAETTKKIGKILGVEAIVTGTILDINGNTAEINARVIKTDTAEVIASASAEIANTWAPKPAPQNEEPAQEESQPVKPRLK